MHALIFLLNISSGYRIWKKRLTYCPVHIVFSSCGGKVPFTSDCDISNQCGTSGHLLLPYYPQNLTPGAPDHSPDTVAHIASCERTSNLQVFVVRVSFKAKNLISSMLSIPVVLVISFFRNSVASTARRLFQRSSFLNFHITCFAYFK